MSRLTIIVAATKSNGIGVRGGLPWRLPKEMKYFAKATSHAPEGLKNEVIMGRNTWESIPAKFKPLPNRRNIVVSLNTNYDLGVPVGQDVALKSELSTALTASSTGIHRRFIIGGAAIYKETLSLPPTTEGPVVDRVLLTRILAPEFEECDVFMPDFVNSTGESGERQWERSSHKELEDWIGFEVPEGEQEEKGVKYEFQMWLRVV